MAHLECRRIYHRDLSSRSIFFNSATCNIKIGNIGVAGFYTDPIEEYYTQKLRSDPRGPRPVRWLALEAIKDYGCFTSASDVWTFGVLAWELFSCLTKNFAPYGNKITTHVQILELLDRGERMRSPKSLTGNNRWVSDLIKMCWRRVPEERPEFSMISSSFEQTLGVGYKTYYPVTPKSSNLTEGKIVKKKKGTQQFAADLLVDYEIDRTLLGAGIKIGEGNFGEVHRAFYSARGETPIQVAIKLLKHNSKKKEEEEFAMEAEMMSQFNHTNVTNLLGVVFTSKPCLVILEFIEHGDLKVLFDIALPKKPDGLDPLFIPNSSEFIVLIAQIAAGMAHIASKNVVHRDLACRNCLLAANNIVKVADMGLARKTDEQDAYTSTATRALPLKWMAPEAISMAKFSEASDVWGFGIVVWEVYTLCHVPWKGTVNKLLFNAIEAGKRPPKPDRVPYDIWTIVKRCWHADPKQRPAFKEMKLLLTEIAKHTVRDRPITRDIGASILSLSTVATSTRQAGLSIEIAPPPQKGKLSVSDITDKGTNEVSTKKRVYPGSNVSSKKDSRSPKSRSYSGSILSQVPALGSSFDVGVEATKAISSNNPTPTTTLSIRERYTAMVEEHLDGTTASRPVASQSCFGEKGEDTRTSISISKRVAQEDVGRLALELKNAALTPIADVNTGASTPGRFPKYRLPRERNVSAEALESRASTEERPQDDGFSAAEISTAGVTAGNKAPTRFPKGLSQRERNAAAEPPRPRAFTNWSFQSGNPTVISARAAALTTSTSIEPAAQSDGNIAYCGKFTPNRFNPERCASCQLLEYACKEATARANAAAAAAITTNGATAVEDCSSVVVEVLPPLPSKRGRDTSREDISKRRMSVLEMASVFQGQSDDEFDA